MSLPMDFGLVYKHGMKQNKDTPSGHIQGKLQCASIKSVALLMIRYNSVNISGKKRKEKKTK